MRNRAKCKLCEEILESFHRHDYVTCKCGEIFIDGGQDYLRCGANDWQNFLRVEDDGTITYPKIVEKSEEIEVIAQEIQKETTITTKPSRKETIEMLKLLIDSIENLPAHAMTAPVTHYDLSSALFIIHSILKEETVDEKPVD